MRETGGDFAQDTGFQTPQHGVFLKETWPMNNEFGADLITLIDDEGVEHEFEILDEIDNDDGVFYALLPTFDDPQSELESEGTYYIFEVIEEDGEEQLAEVEDDELLDKLAAIFESRFEELYEDEDSAEWLFFCEVLL